MVVRNKLLGYAILFLIFADGVSCHSSGGYTKSENKNSTLSNAAASNISDSDWELRLIEELPKTEAPDHIRCNRDGFCWLWDLEAIWLSNDGGSWRKVYVLPRARRQHLESIDDVSMISSQIGWFITYRGLYKTLDGGLNWMPTSGPILSHSDSGFSRVFFRDDKHGWLAGGEYRPRLAGEPAVNNAISGDLKYISIGSHLAD